VIKLLLPVFRAMLLASSLIEPVPLMKKIPKGTNLKKRKKYQKVPTSKKEKNTKRYQL
jgi:hypothetical protein